MWLSHRGAPQIESMLKHKKGKTPFCVVSILAKLIAMGLQHWKDLLMHIEEWPTQSVNFYPNMVFSCIEFLKSGTRALHGGVCRGMALGGAPLQEQLPHS